HKNLKMKLKFLIRKARLLGILFFIIIPAANAQNIQLKSPNGSITVSFKLTDKIYYTISYDDEVLLRDNYLQLNLHAASLGKNPKLKNKKQEAISNTILPKIPLKYATVKNTYNRLVLNFKGNYTVEFRAFDDGVAYRFKTNKKGDISVLSEDFGINFPSDYLAHLQQPDGFKTSYEERYTHIATQDWKPSDKMAT